MNWKFWKFFFVGILITTIIILTLNINYYESFDISECNQNQLTDEDVNSDKFKIQYTVGGYCTEDILNTIKQVIAKAERIITKTTGNNYTITDNSIPVTYKGKKFIKDIYVKFNITDENIKEESGAESKDTIGGSNIIIDKTFTNAAGEFQVFPVLCEITLDKATALDDLKFHFDTNENPYAAGKNRFYYVVLHELFHVLGVGFLWTFPEYDSSYDKSTYDRFWIDPSNYLYIGPKKAKYNGLSATVYYYNELVGKPQGTYKAIPIENDGLEGTKLWHWEQGLYKDENGIVVSKDDRVVNGVKAPGLDYEIEVGWGIENKAPAISKVTIGNLEDLGYQVNYSESEMNSLQYSQATSGSSNTKISEMPITTNDDESQATADTTSKVNTSEINSKSSSNYLLPVVIGTSISLCLIITVTILVYIMNKGNS